MNNTNTGGPAFPFVHDMPPSADQPAGTKLLMVYDGMTLRDYFAAKAMQAVIAATPPEIDVAEPHLSKWSYAMADAMLKARAA